MVNFLDVISTLNEAKIQKEHFDYALSCVVNSDDLMQKIFFIFFIAN